MEFHPAANIFPLLEDEELDGLRESIKQHGQQEPIVVFDDKILDGRNRYRAILTIPEIEPWYQEARLAPGGSPTDYVITRNLHRRHLDTGQRAMIAGRVIDSYEAEAKERKKRKPADSVRENLPEQKGRARDKAGAAVGVSGKSVDHAAKVLEFGSKRLQRAVDKGDISVSKAAKLADLPHGGQNEALDAPTATTSNVSITTSKSLRLPDDPDADTMNTVDAWLEKYDDRPVVERFKVVWNSADEVGKAKIRNFFLTEE